MVGLKLHLEKNMEVEELLEWELVKLDMKIH
jgi:hypothetical protein